MLKSSVYDHSDGYIFAKETITADMGTAPSQNKKNIEVVSKYCVPFTDCISEINNIQVDNARDNEVVTSIYNLIEHSTNYSKTSRNLWKYYRDEPNNLITASKSFIFKSRLLNSTNNEDSLNLEKTVPSK